MRVFIAGMDGYLGWPLAMYLARRGHKVFGADAFFRRKWVREIGGQSATPIASMKERLMAFKEVFGKEIKFWQGDMRNFEFVRRSFADSKPDAIVHLGEQPSAPYSMKDIKHASFTQENNIIGTLNILFAIYSVCPSAHLVKLGTMGEYGTPNIPIPEGFFIINYRGRTDTLPFPRQAGSWYHLSKVHDSQNITFACRAWKLRSTDLMQGPVYSAWTEETCADERLLTRFDFDEAFGTAINRFCTQAVIGFPLTPYGKGGQKRGYLNIIDSMRCLELAISNPPAVGEYRVFNQFTEIFSINELAEAVRATGQRIGLGVEISNLKVDPRVESEEHYYDADHKKLIDLGLKAHRMKDALQDMLESLLKYKKRIIQKRNHILPTIYWSKEKKRMALISQKTFKR